MSKFPCCGGNDDDPPTHCTDCEIRCFACGRKFRSGETQYLVDTFDAQRVYVGSDCFKKVEAAGDKGYRPAKGGPIIYLLEAKP